MVPFFQNYYSFFGFPVERCDGIGINRSNQEVCDFTRKHYTKYVALVSDCGIGSDDCLAERQELRHKTFCAYKRQIRLPVAPQQGAVSVNRAAPEISIHGYPCDLSRKGLSWCDPEGCEVADDLIGSYGYGCASVAVDQSPPYVTWFAGWVIDRYRRIRFEEILELLYVSYVFDGQFEFNLVAYDTAISHQEPAPIRGVGCDLGESCVIDGVLSVPDPLATTEDQLLRSDPTARGHGAPDDDGYVPVVDAECNGDILGPVTSHISGKRLRPQFWRDDVATLERSAYAGASHDVRFLARGGQGCRPASNRRHPKFNESVFTAQGRW